MSEHDGRTATEVEADKNAADARAALAAERDAGLRSRIASLAEQLDAEADGICPRGHYDKKDKAWRVAHVRRRVAEDLRAALAEGRA